MMRLPFVLVLALLAPAAAQAQATAALHGRVIDELDGSPVVAAAVVLRSLAPPAVPGSLPLTRRAETDATGGYRFTHLPRGRYALVVERIGYRGVTLEVTLDRDEPLVVTVVLDPVAFNLDPVALAGLRGPGPSLVEPRPVHGIGPVGDRTAAVRARQAGLLSSDAVQLSRADLRESNTLAEDDVFRALQSTPGVARRDDFTVDLWTRGAPAGHTVVTFDGIPMISALHALGVLSGLNSDMLHTATFQPGIASAASPGGGAAVIDLESRSPANAPRFSAATLTPVSARITVDGRPSERVALAVGARRSHLDLLSAITDELVPGNGMLGYAFTDVTARADIVVTDHARIEASTFLQNDRMSADGGDARNDDGAWSTRVARITLVTALDGLALRHTLGMSDFDASVGILPAVSAEGTPLHPPTENHYGTLLWETRIDAGTGTDGDVSWSLGMTTRQEQQRYNGPGIDPASLLTPDALARRGVVEFGPIVLDIDRARLVKEADATRVAVWAERRGHVTPDIEYTGGLRIETGDRVQGDDMRLAPRLLVRYRPDPATFAISAGYGRAYQYTQSIARTDVLRSGLRASEVLVQAGRDAPALRSDVVTLGFERWIDVGLLLGATGWWRASAGVLVPTPVAGPLDEPRSAVTARGSARGVELSLRKLTGRVRGFANYGLSRSQQHIGTHTFDASEDRRHVTNLSVVTDVRPSWQVGSTFRAESGAPYTRLTLVSTSCRPGSSCDDASPVMLGTVGGQRGPAYASVDLMTEWTHTFGRWSLSAFGQLRNALGSGNAVTYHSSCLCIDDDASGETWLGDRFDRGLPRLPIVGLRARF